MVAGCEFGVAQRHLGCHVSHQRHQGREPDSAVDEFGPEGVPQLVRGDMQGGAVAAVQAGGGDGVVEALAEPVGGRAAAAFEEKELGRPAGAGVGQGPLPAPLSDPPVDDLDRVGFERDDAFAAEFAQRDPYPGAVAVEVEQAVQLQVQQFPHAHAGRAQQEQSGAGEGVVQSGSGGHQGPVEVRWQGPGQRLGHPRDVAVEHQLSRWRRGPSPAGDVFEEAAQLDDVLVVDAQTDRLGVPALAAPGAAAGPDQVRLDVAGPLDLVQPGHVAMVVGEVVEEHPQRLGPPGHGVRAQRGRHRGDVADHLGPDQGSADTGGVPGRSPRDRPGRPWWRGQAAELVAGLLQAE